MSKWDTDKSLKQLRENAREYFVARAKIANAARENPIEYRTDGGRQIALPGNPNMAVPTAINTLVTYQEAEQATIEYNRVIQTRPYAGAFAFSKVLTEHYGVSPIGKEQVSFFGSSPPEVLTAKIGVNRSVQVPFGLMTFPPLEAEFLLMHTYDKDMGPAFVVGVHAKKKHEEEIQGMLDEVEEQASEFNIYNGTAMIGTGSLDGSRYVDAEFRDMYKGTNRRKIIYSTDVQEALDDGIYGLIINAKVLREPYEIIVRLDDPTDEEENLILSELRVELDSDIPLQYDADGAFYTYIVPGEDIGNKVLLHGEPGSGKTEAIRISAQICLEHGWTFIQCRPDDDLKQALRFGESLGCPFVLAIEDIEKLVPSTPKEMDEFLEQFDGMRTKGREAILVLTTNHPEELPKTLMRAGRLNRMIEFGDLDRASVEKLINVSVPRSQREDLDYEELHTAYEGYAPNWIAQALTGVRLRSGIRTGKRGMPLSTADFVRAANALRDAWKRYKGAKYKPDKPVLDTLLQDMIRKAAQEAYDDRYVVDLSDGEIMIRN